MITEEQYQDIKTRHVEHVKRYIKDMGSVFPHITVYSKRKSENDDVIIHIPVPDDLMKSEDLKERFVTDIIPKLAEQLHKDFEPYGVAWTCEAWVRSSPQKDGFPDNWKQLPVDGEILMVSIEFENKNEMIIYDIKRTGKQVTEDGDIVDHVDLIERDMSGADGWSGRFVGLLKRFKTDSSAS